MIDENDPNKLWSAHPWVKAADAVLAEQEEWLARGLPEAITWWPGERKPIRPGKVLVVALCPPMRIMQAYSDGDAFWAVAPLETTAQVKLCVLWWAEWPSGPEVVQ